jgi:hypothetical protein
MQKMGNGVSIEPVRANSLGYADLPMLLRLDLGWSSEGCYWSIKQSYPLILV